MQKAQERREDRGEKKDRALLHIDVHPQNPISAYEANNRGTIRAQRRRQGRKKTPIPA